MRLLGDYEGNSIMKHSGLVRMVCVAMWAVRIVWVVWVVAVRRVAMAGSYGLSSREHVASSSPEARQRHRSPVPHE